MHVLLVDDSSTMRTIQKKALTALGEVKFTEAGDGVAGLAAMTAAGATFDVVLLDWNMPNMDGLTMATKVRQGDKKTPIIMVTTEAEKTRIIDALKAGVNNYVIKPFTPDVLVAKVRQTLEKCKAAA
jgi:two-component system chemotaxis response regulator CheY